jgi:hypothetical protein
LIRYYPKTWGIFLALQKRFKMKLSKNTMVKIRNMRQWTLWTTLKMVKEENSRRYLRIMRISIKTRRNKRWNI